MEKFWSPLSWNWDRHNLEYLSSIEAVNYPFVGVQFHPEKNIYEWSVKEPRIPHSKWVSTILKILRDRLTMYKQRLYLDFAIVTNFVQARCACLPLLRHPLCEHGPAQQAQVHGQVRRLLCVRPTSFLHFVVCGLKAGGGNTSQLQLQTSLRGSRRYWMDI